MARKQASSEPIPTPTVVPDFPLASITPNAANPRTITDENKQGLHSSLKRFGMAGVLVVNERVNGDRILVSGHQRLADLLASGATTGPVVITKLSIHDETALGLTLNGHHGRWKDDALKAQLDELRTAGRDIERLGLHNEASYKQAMEELGELAKTAPAKAKEEAPAEEAGPVKVTIGQYRFELTADEHAKVKAAATADGIKVIDFVARRLGVA